MQAVRLKQVLKVVYLVSGFQDPVSDVVRDFIPVWSPTQGKCESLLFLEHSYLTLKSFHRNLLNCLLAWCEDGVVSYRFLHTMYALLAKDPPHISLIPQGVTGVTQWICLLDRLISNVIHSDICWGIAPVISRPLVQCKWSAWAAKIPSVIVT